MGSSDARAARPHHTAVNTQFRGTQPQVPAPTVMAAVEAARMADTKVAPKMVEKKEEAIATVVEAPATSIKSKEAVESVQSGFVINKETENKVTVNIAEKKHELSIKDEKESSPKESTELVKNEIISKENLTKISEPATTALVDVAVIKECESDDNVSPKEELETALNAMPGMTKSVSKEVLAQA